jgi:hypothetical protein
MKNTLFLVGMLAVGCGSADLQSSGGDESELGGELSTRSRSYVTLRRDTRRCAAPKCGGWWVQDVNRATPNEQYVSRLDFASSSLSDLAQHDVTYAPDGEVVLFGKLGLTDASDTRPFLVSAGWRGMPGVSAVGATFYRVQSVEIRCITAPCPTLKATRLNSTSSTLTHDLDVHKAARSLVDEAWLTHQIGRAHV